MLKKIYRHPIVMALLSRIVAGYISFVFKTCRWQFVGKEHIQTHWDKEEPLVTCFWHGRMLMMPCAWMSSSPFSMLISGHPDGQIIAKTIAHHGIGTVVGSKSKGGLEALRTIVSQLKKGVTVGITPDGPRGPRFKASDGIVIMSKLSGVDILPCTYATQRAIVINSWDRFRIPLPFSKAVFMWGELIPAPPKTAKADALEVTRQKVETSLNDLCAQADRLCLFQERG